MNYELFFIGSFFNKFNPCSHIYTSFRKILAFIAVRMIGYFYHVYNIGLYFKYSMDVQYKLVTASYKLRYFNQDSNLTLPLVFVILITFHLSFIFLASLKCVPFPQFPSPSMILHYFQACKVMVLQAL